MPHPPLLGYTQISLVESQDALPHAKRTPLLLPLDPDDLELPEPEPCNAELPEPDPASSLTVSGGLDELEQCIVNARKESAMEWKSVRGMRSPRAIGAPSTARSEGAGNPRGPHRCRPLHGM
jgi:hypothetical protein